MNKNLFILPLVTLIVGCSSSVPECSDTEVISLVKEITNDEMIEKVGSETANSIVYTLDSIRTIDINDKTGAFECAAQLGVSSSTNDYDADFPITYTVEKTDDGKEFYVNVFGL